MADLLEPLRLTLEDLLRRTDETAGFDLVDGRLEENRHSVKSSLLAGRILAFVWEYSKKLPGGDVFPPGSGFRCFAFDRNLVRNPDLANVASGRLSHIDYKQAFCPIVPDLVVEVLSPNDLASRINTKVDEWLEANVRLVWVIDPDTKTVLQYTPAGPTRRYRNSDTLSGGDVLPGFNLPLADLFRRVGPVTKT